jgi:hypothetical protein
MKQMEAQSIQMYDYKCGRRGLSVDYPWFANDYRSTSANPW